MDVNHRFPFYERQRIGFLVSTDPRLFDLKVLHHFLSQEAYWSRGVSRQHVARSMQHSLCFGLYALAAQSITQAGFARVVSDFTTFAYIADVFVLSPYRGQGLGKWLVACLLDHPELGGLRKWMLSTCDAHGLYRPLGFRALRHPEHYMVYRP